MSAAENKNAPLLVTEQRGAVYEKAGAFTS